MHQICGISDFGKNLEEIDREERIDHTAIAIQASERYPQKAQAPTQLVQGLVNRYLQSGAVVRDTIVRQENCCYHS